MGGQTELAGPDLTVGVDATSIKPGDKLLGHARGEPVLLARIGDEYVAIAASCTHYGGPLAEGLVVGERQKSHPTTRMRIVPIVDDSTK